jgi:thiosulfate/3-mercaptopyruvate sulfurtransferase
MSDNRYTSQAPEPRPGLSSGHIPHSLSLPFTSLLTKESSFTTLKPVDELQSIIRNAVGSEDTWNAIKSGDRKLVFSCGSGMTAAINWLSLRLVLEGKEDVAALYDEVSPAYQQNLI